MQRFSAACECVFCCCCTSWCGLTAETWHAAATVGIACVILAFRCFVSTQKRPYQLYGAVVASVLVGSLCAENPALQIRLVLWPLLYNSMVPSLPHGPAVLPLSPGVRILGLSGHELCKCDVQCVTGILSGLTASFGLKRMAPVAL